MKCIFSGTSIEMPGNDALRLAMNSDVPCSVNRLQIVICVPIVMHVCRALLISRATVTINVHNVLIFDG